MCLYFLWKTYLYFYNTANTENIIQGEKVEIKFHLKDTDYTALHSFCLTFFFLQVCFIIYSRTLDAQKKQKKKIIKQTNKTKQTINKQTIKQKHKE